MEGTPGLDTNATWEEEIPEQNKITADAVERMMERQDRERQEGRLGADETLSSLPGNNSPIPCLGIIPPFLRAIITHSRSRVSLLDLQLSRDWVRMFNVTT